MADSTEDKSKVQKDENRFLHPYYVLNALLVIAYALLRVQRLTAPPSLSTPDMFGVTREMQIYLCLGMMLFSRGLSAPTIDSYLSSVFAFSRVAVLASLWYMHARLFVLFLTLWVVLYAVCPQPRFRMPDSVATLTAPTFNERIAKNRHRTIYVLWCHAAWSARSAQLAPVLAQLARSYAHPRIRFARIDVSKFEEVAKRLNVSTSAGSKQLPCVICFKQGKEVARIPTVDAKGNIPREWYRGFKAGHVAQALDLRAMMRTAKEWEAEAQEKYRQQQVLEKLKKSRT